MFVHLSILPRGDTNWCTCGPPGGEKLVSTAPYCKYVLRICGIIAKLAADTAYVNIDPIVGCIVHVADSKSSKSFPRDHVVRIRHQAMQYAHLHGSEQDTIAIGHTRSERMYVEPDTVLLNRRVHCGSELPVRAPQHSLHPRQQLGGLERLDYVVVGSCFQTGQPISHLGPRRKHDNRQMLISLLQMPHHRETVSPWELDI